MPVSDLFASVAAFVQEHRSDFDVIQALGSIVSLVGWSAALCLFITMWATGRITSVSLFGFRAEFAAVRSAAAADRKMAARLGRTAHVVPIGRIRKIISRAFRRREQERIVGKTILWVDDRKDSISDEMNMFRNIGLEIVWAPSTQSALERLDAQKPDIIISDMGRPPDDRAGYELLQSVRSRSGTRDIPFLIYSGSDKPEHIKEAKEKGAQGATNDPLVLFQLVISQLVRG